MYGIKALEEVKKLAEDDSKYVALINVGYWVFHW